jgi:hypothetical protein
MSTFTLFHVAISLAGIVAGFIVFAGLIAKKRLDAWTAIFLGTTIATSVTGFLFPIKGITPGLVIGAISLVILTIAVYARYAMKMAGTWRKIYVVTSAVAFYLNFLVLIVQSFQKIPVLHALAPTGAELPVMIAQTVALAGFLSLGALATIKFDETRASVV